MGIRTKILCFVIVLYIPAVLIWPDVSSNSDLSDLINHLNKPVRIETKPGGNFQGILKDVEDDRIEIIDRDGLILQIDIQSIESYIVLEEEITKETFFQDSASNRLIVMPTGFAMEPGELHVADQEIAAVTLSYGLNEHFSFWSGISIPGFLLSGRYTASVAPNFAVSLGSFVGFSWLEELQFGVMLPYCIASWGEPNNNITIGLSPCTVLDGNEEKLFKLEGLVFSFGGKKVITPSSSLIFENWIIWAERREYEDSMEPIAEWQDYSPLSEYWDFVPLYVFPAVAFRIAGQRFSWDIGVVFPLKIASWEEVVIEQDPGPSVGYWRNTGYRLQGVGGAFIPIPILSVTYRID